MSFETVTSKKGRPGGTFIRFARTKSGGAECYSSALLGLVGQRIEIQLDRENKTVRLRPSDKGSICRRTGLFHCASVYFTECGQFRISVTPGADGWWYGNYSSNFQKGLTRT